MFVSPNRGLFWFSPLFVLLIPAVVQWRRWTSWQRQLVFAFGIPCVLYILMIGTMRNWAHLVGVRDTCCRSCRFSSCPLRFVPALDAKQMVEHDILDSREHRRRTQPSGRARELATDLGTAPDGVEQWTASPAQQWAACQGAISGLLGQDLPAPIAHRARDAELRATTRDFPDLLIARIAETRGWMLAATIGLTLTASAVASRDMSTAPGCARYRRGALNAAAASRQTADDLAVPALHSARVAPPRDRA